MSRRAKVPEGNSLRPALAELERAFTQFAFLFKREMPLPVITVQTKGRRLAAGWFAPEKWQHNQREAGPAVLPEINLCAEYLAASVEEIAHVLIHEMCHYANALEGIRDCAQNCYHNKHFKARC